MADATNPFAPKGPPKSFYDFYRKQYGVQTVKGESQWTDWFGGAETYVVNPEAEAAARAAANATHERRMAGAREDYTSALLRRVQSAELLRLGVGKTRQSLFSVDPSTVILSGGYGK